MAGGVAPSPGPGLVVESIDPGSAAERVGIRSGDRLTSWSEGADYGALSSPFDLEDIEGARAPRGPVSLKLSRGGEETVVGLAEEAWGIHARPELAEPAVEVLAHARAADAAGRHAEAARALAELAEGASEPRVRAWLHVESGEAWASIARWEDAQGQFTAALAGLAPRDAADVWVSRARAYTAADSAEPARAAYQQAVLALQAAGPKGLRTAEVLLPLCRLMGDKAAAVPLARRASDLAESLAPDSLLLTRAWTNEAVRSYEAGDVERATSLMRRRTHAVQRRRVPGTSMEATTLVNLGVFAFDAGDLATAESSLRAATGIFDRLAGDEFYHSSAYLNLGAVLAQRGELDAAEDALKRSLAIAERLPVLGSGRPEALINLGQLAAERGDPARAEELMSEAVRLVEAADPRSQRRAGPLNSLGELLLSRGDLPRAEACFRQARSLLADVQDGAAALPEAILGLGDVARARGDLPSAAARYREAADLDAKWRPGSFGEAEALGRLGALRAESGRLEEAAELYAAALQALERQRGKLGAVQEQGATRMADHVRLYAEYVDLLVALRRPAQAFQVVEASRARALVELLAQRDLGFSRDIPERLDGERRAIKASYDRVQAELEQLDARGGPRAAERLSARLHELQQSRLRIADEIRRESPGLAEIEDPRPVSVPEARRALDPGTLLLSYLVGERTTTLFAVEPEADAGAGPSGLATFEIRVGKAELREKVAAFLALVQDRGAAPGQVLVASEGLYRLLLAPAEGLLSSSARILISPDGPLQALPFAALVRPAHPGGPRRYLVELRPIHTIASATLYVELRRRRERRAPPPEAIAAFGDPVYPDAPQVAEEVRLRSGVRRRSLSPLPGTRREVDEIVRLFPGRATSYLGRDASEENAKALSRAQRYVHFGCHAVLNPRSPLDSGLVLSQPEVPREGQENGILQAWEIFEDLRLDADLVTLSACESGLGTEVAGQGLIGLTRAFQYAGARSVLASLWDVSDDSTAELMARFYGELKGGAPKDQALQAAQLSLLGRGHGPFHWAAFQLTGDWR